MKKALSVVAAMMLSASLGVQAAPPKDAEEVVQHLEFLGYEVVLDEERIQASHDQHLNILIKSYRGGMLVTAFFGGSDYGKSHQTEWKQLLNVLNEQSAAARYYVDGDGDMAIEGYYPGRYHRTNFGVFLDAYNLEQENIAAVSDAIEPFIE